jgi:glutamate carboxypeptidase
MSLNRMKFLTFISCIFFVSFSQAAQLDKKEQGIVKSIDQNQSHALSLLEKVVNINSGTMNFAGVKHVGQLFSKEFQALGFKTQWIDGTAFNRAGHLVASYGSAKNSSKKLLLIGHLDTVFTQNSHFKNYQAIDQQHVAGPGITDMKGGDVVIISALKALKASGVLAQLQIKVIMTGDEEKRGTPYKLATKALLDAGKWADIALGFEDGDGNAKTAVIARRGASGWLLKVNGRPAHSSQIFQNKYGGGAIFEAARILNSFRLALAKQPNLTFNPGLIVGGTTVDFDRANANASVAGKTNVIAQTTIVNGDIRALSPLQLTKAQAVMQKTVADNLAQTSATLSFSSGYPPMAPSQGNKRLLALYNQTSIDLGFGEVVAVDPQKAGAADISFVANYVDMALDGLGLMGTGGHTIDEVADIATLNSQTKRAAVLIYRLSQ